MASDPSDAAVAFVPIRPLTALRHVRRPMLGVALTLSLIVPASCGHAADAAEAPARDVFEAGDDEAGDEGWQETPAEADVLLPADRARERVLDRARRLVADQRWSDAAATLDELLAVEQDAFAGGGATATRNSIRSEAAALVEQLPRAGRETYERLFGGRAERQLVAAIAADDAVAIVAVARRWLHTPAGRQAAMLAAIRALESDQPLASSAWLDRLARTPSAAAIEPTLSVLRAAAKSAAGDDAAADRLLFEASRRGRSSVRLAGRDLALPLDARSARTWLADAGLAGGVRTAGPAGEWRQFRGVPSRNGIVDATRPLLVPRYRVPLVRHPEEARRLEKYRLAAVADAGPLLPAGTPLAVGGRLVVQTQLGILAVDFESGRRLWLQSAVPSADAEPDEESGRPSPPRLFHDATIGNLASDGTSIFAVESRPETVRPLRIGFTGIDRRGGPDDPLVEGNTLSSYALDGGRLRWRLSGREAEGRDGEAAARWHLGPPLVVGDELFVLVERQEEVRLEARSATDSSLRWVQPLATYDQGDLADRDATIRRRLAGLTPALAEGVLVCPIGAGSVVAIDVATRSLLWAHAYPRPEPPRARGGFRNDPPADRNLPFRTGEPAPVIVGDRVIVAPFDTELVLCLGLEDGAPIWQRPRARGLSIAGAVDDRLLLVGGDGVEAVDLKTGRRLWHTPLGDGVRPSGRGIVTPRGLLVPCDAPAVIELALVDGAVTGRSVARGGGIPGNLVAHRGELISRGIDSLDVFHQEAALEQRIETAVRTAPDDAWAAYWRGQSALEAGDVDAGLAALARAAEAPGFRMPPAELAAAVAYAMQTDFPKAAKRWADFPGAAADRASPEVDRLTVDGFLAQHDASAAWSALARLMMAATASDGPPAMLLDGSDTRLSIATDRWLQSRLARVTAAADESLRGRIDATCRDLAAAVLARPTDEARRRAAESACGRLGRHPAADALRELLRAPGETWTARRELLALEDRANASPPATADDPAAGGWPLGQVDRRESRIAANREAGGPSQSRPMPLTVALGFDTRVAQASVDVARQRLTVTDHLGRPLGRPLPVPGLGGGFGLPFLGQSGEVELAALGRMVFVRSATGVFAHRLPDDTAAAEAVWGNGDLGTEAEEAAGRWGGVAGRVARDGAAPLGLRIGEPDERPRGGGRGMTALPAGLVVPGRRSVAVLDAATGTVLWERGHLPAGLEWFVDGDFLCGCTVDGRDSLVLAMLDGRLVHRFDVPHRRQRVAARGRRFVAVEPLDEPAAAGIAPRVRLDLVDAADRELRPLGVFDGRSRATETGDGRLAVLEPGGRLTMLDLADGGVVFRQTLPAIPRQVERLIVHPWTDRYLVLAGAADGDDPTGAVAFPLETMMLAGGTAAPLSGVVWAVGRDDGRPLWPGPAIIDQQCLHTAQPAGLPVLVFCRLLKSGDRGQSALSVLCLDKRTGHAVFEDDRIRLDGQPTGDCVVSGDPEAHTVSIADVGTTGHSLTLTFSGRPMAPRPPFRSRGRPPAAAGGGLFDDRVGPDSPREE